MSAVSGNGAAPPSRLDGRLRIAILVLSLIGIGVAGYLTYTHYAKIKVLCGSNGGCETVQSSVYSKLDGVPVAVLGLAGYIGILFSLAIRSELGRAADRLSVQHVPDVSGGVHDSRLLLLVPLERPPDDAARGPHRDPIPARRRATEAS
jgi:hypothetical protein